MSFDRIPQEMRSFNQWVVWKYEERSGDKPTKVPYSPNGQGMAAVDRPETWGAYMQAIAAYHVGGYDGIGFVLTEADPYGFIDLDDTKGDAAAYEKQLRIYQEFDSYAEFSPSGKGLHIIIKGSLPSGRKRSFVEVYSSRRYMTMTGNIYRDAPIVDYHNLFNVLHSQMGKTNDAELQYAGFGPEQEPDETIIERARTARNGDKFEKLYRGDWEEFYSSQSEADFALVDIIAFYSPNRAQIARIFRASALGKRDKAKRSDYVNYMLNRCFDRMLPPIDVEGLRNAVIEAIEAKKVVIEEHSPAVVESPQFAEFPTGKAGIYTVPPGLVGAIAQFIYAQSPRPVAEISLAGAIGLVAGIVGRSYNVSNTGLNQYVLLLAPTGVGKESIASGIDKLMQPVSKSVPAASEFIGPSEIASPQAMAKYLSKNAASFVSMVGEFGLYLQQMSSPNAPPVMVGLKRMFLDLFNKSGEGKSLRPTIYSDRDKNTQVVLSPAFTLLGESTPERFYGALNESMITEGLLPRFTTIEYHGDLTDFNESHALAKPEFSLIEHLSTLCAHSLMLNSQHRAVHVGYTNEAKKTLDDFRRFAEEQVRGSREVKRQLWTRAHVKALKLAALVAVGCNPYEPTISEDVALWAINIIAADVQNLLTKFESGEIAVDNEEQAQVNAIVKCVTEFVTFDWARVEKYLPNGHKLHANKIIPYSYIQRRLSNAAVFRKDKRGSSEALKRTLKTLADRGEIQEVSRAKLSVEYDTSALCFMISNPKAFAL